MGNEQLWIPAFHHNVQDWLLHMEGYLVNTSVTDQQKFTAVVGVLPTEVATLMHETTASPPTSEKFATLKQALLNIYHCLDHHHLHELQTTTLGDMWPSLLWHRMKLVNSSTRSKSQVQVSSETTSGGKIAPFVH